MSTWPSSPHDGGKIRRDARALWEEIFSEDSSSFVDYYFREIASKNRIQTRYDGERLVSMVQWNPYRLQVRDEVWQSYYLVGVATRADCRHRGYMAGLLREGLQALAAERVPFVFLMPADPAIYTPFDFRYMYEKREEIRPVGGLPVQTPGAKEKLPAKDSGDGLPVRALRPEEYAFEADWLNRRLRAETELFCLRDEACLRREAAECASEGGELAGIFRGGEPAALFSWWEEEGVSVRWLVPAAEYARGKKREELMAALTRYFTGRETIRIVTPDGEGGRKPAIMGRIVCLEAFLGAFRTPDAWSLVLQVQDPIVPENDGTFRWNAGPRGSSLTRTAEPPELVIPVHELMEWLLGVRFPACREEALRGKLAQIPVLRGAFLPEIV